MNQNGSHIEEHLLLQYLLGNVADAERSAVEAWLRESEANRAMLDKLEGLWLETGKLDPPPLAVDLDAGWVKLSDRIAIHEAAPGKAKPNTGSIRFLRYAVSAAATLLLLFGVYALVRFITARPGEIEMAATSGVVHDTLPDGSRITLNLQSKLICPDEFDMHDRKVELTGEALFEVTKDPARPFIIMAGEAGIRVLGTTFTVKAYPGKPVMVAVSEGRVQFFRVDARSGDTLSIILVAGESGILKPGAKIPESTDERAPDNLFWANRTLEFNGTPLSEVFELLRKYYSLDIAAGKPEILNCRLSATFANDPPDRIMHVIAESFGLTLTSRVHNINLPVMDAVKPAIRGCLLVLLIACFTLRGACQGSYLSRKVTVDIPRCSLDIALRELGKAGQFRFSYDADILANSTQVSIKATDARVGALLKEMLGRDIRPKEVGNHVILVRNRVESREKQAYPDMVITGTIYDASNRQPLADATVYEVENKKSAVSSSGGSFRIVVPSGKRVRGLTFCKAGYSDTVIFIRQASNLHLDVMLNPPGNTLSRMNVIPAPVVANTTDSLGVVKWLVPRETMVNSQNLEVRTSRTFQASVIPYIGTNWKITGSVTNRFSLNLLAGYTGGLQGLEIGGLLNITRNNVSGVQVGGLGNIVGGTGNGWQVGGLFNFDLGKFNGVQIGGLFNYAPDTIGGLQIGGLANVVTGRIKGVQIAGLTNIVTENCNGWQLAGLLNLTLKDVKKVQLAGLMNYGSNADGLQVAGLVNVATQYNSGVQIAGLVNYATRLHGLQLGLINISKKVERGVPIGLFSFVLEGYHLFEVSGNEVFYGNVAFKSGTRSFYNFVQVGMGSDYKLQGSYGIGTIFTLKKKLSMNIDASAGFVYHPTDTIYHGLLLKFNPALEYRFAKHFAIFGGPAYNFFLFTKGEASATPRGLSSYDFYFESTENASIQMWIGGVVGIRL